MRSSLPVPCAQRRRRRIADEVERSLLVRVAREQKTRRCEGLALEVKEKEGDLGYFPDGPMKPESKPAKIKKAQVELHVNLHRSGYA